ncbi:MAG: hypothetical protein FWD11_06730 [Micrococcales bacterium]|nr:hypothetical protein [Micrococcales bacterium]
MNRHAPVRALVVVPALLLAVSCTLVGCAEDKADTEKIGPVESRIHDVYGAWSEERWYAFSVRAEELIAACMKEKGFEYLPVPPDMGYQSSTGPDQGTDDVDDDPVAYAKEHGYGIVPASKAEYQARWGSGEDTPADNPNDAYYEGLSPTQQEAYDEALSGRHPVDEDEYESGSHEYDWTAFGCAGEAQHEVWDKDETPIDDTVIDDYYAYVEDQVANDPRVHKAEKNWSSCMSGKGYDFRRPENAWDSIVKKYNELAGSNWDSLDWEPNLDQISDADLASLHADEITTATADAQCDKKAGVTESHNNASFDADTEFYRTHKAEVDAWYDAHQAARKN